MSKPIGYIGAGWTWADALEFARERATKTSRRHRVTLRGWLWAVYEVETP